MKPLEVEERLDQPLARRVAVEHGQHVDAEDVGKIGLVVERVAEGVADMRRRQRRVGQPAGNALGDRILQGRLVEHHLVHQSGQRRLAPRDRLGFVAHPPPHRIVHVDCDLFAHASLPLSGPDQNRCQGTESNV
ncbi:MAG: hypothetical protein AcusKO_23110 [Acuticoccus sp.]